MDAEQIITRTENYIAAANATLDSVKGQMTEWLGQTNTVISYGTIDRLIESQARVQVAAHLERVILNQRDAHRETVVQVMIGRLKAELLGASLGGSTNGVANLQDLAYVKMIREALLHLFPTDAF